LWTAARKSEKMKGEELARLNKAWSQALSEGVIDETLYDAFSRGYQANALNTETVNRLEVISNQGRLLVLYDVELELSFQDDNRTLKIFLKPHEPKLCPCAYWAMTIEDANKTRLGGWNHHPRCDGTGKAK
jgi:hypothetical protein